MVLFWFALIVAIVGVGAFAAYNTGAHDITMQSYHFVAVPDWIPVAVGAAVPLSLFLLDAIFARIHIRQLKRAAEEASSQRSGGTSLVPVGKRAAPKRSWTVSRD